MIIFDGDLAGVFNPAHARVWRAPVDAQLIAFRAGHFRFGRFDDYTLVRCRGMPAQVAPEGRLSSLTPKPELTKG